MNRSDCQNLRNYFQDYNYDILILQIVYIISSVITITTNLFLIKKLLKINFKTRSEKLFLIMSISDVGVGLFSIPTLSLPLFIKNFDLICQLSPVFIFLLYVPYSFSYIMVVIISLDRAFMIIKPHIYGKYITIKILYGIIITIFFLLLTASIYYSINDTFAEETSTSRFIVRTSIDVVFVSTTIISYLNLFCYFHKTTRKILPAKKSGVNNSRKLLKTITYIFICLLIFTMPQFIVFIIKKSTNIISKESYIVNRNIYYYQIITLYSNCYANSLIILYNSKNDRKRNISRNTTRSTRSS